LSELRKMLRCQRLQHRKQATILSEWHGHRLCSITERNGDPSRTREGKIRPAAANSE